MLESKSIHSELAAFISPIAKQDRRAFEKAVVGLLGGMLGPDAKQLALEVYDAVRKNRNDQLFEFFLANQEKQEAQQSSLALIRSAVRDTIHEQNFRTNALAGQLLARLERVTSSAEIPLDERSLSDGSFVALAHLAPALLKLERLSLDLIDARIYILRPPLSLTHVEAEVRDLNRSIRSFNDAVDNLRHQRRLTPFPSDFPELMEAIQEGLASAHEREVPPPSSTNPEEAHMEVVLLLDQMARRLYSQRDAISQSWSRVGARVLAHINALTETNEHCADHARMKLADRCVTYFNGINSLVATIRDAPQNDVSREELDRWLRETLTDSIIVNNGNFEWLYDISYAEVLTALKDGLLVARTARTFLEYRSRLIRFHYERVRYAVNSALLPAVRLDQDRDAPIAASLAQMKRLFENYPRVFDVELPAFHREMHLALF